MIIFASVILNFITLARITLVGLRRKASYKQILRLQLRPFLFVLVILCIFLIYWVRLGGQNLITNWRTGTVDPL